MTARAAAPATERRALRARLKGTLRVQRVSPVLTAVAASVFLLADRVAAWRFPLPSRSPRRDFDRSFVEIGAQVLVAILVSIVVGWLIGTQLRR